MSYRPIGPGDFFQLFTFAERAAIKNSTDPLVVSFWDSYQNAIATGVKIDLGSPDIIRGLAYLSATDVAPATDPPAPYLAAGRSQQILNLMTQ